MNLSPRAIATRVKAAVSAVTWPGSSSAGVGSLGVVREGFTGAWQRNVVVDSRDTLLAFSAVYACVSLIVADISTMRMRLVERLPQKWIWQEVENPAFSPVLRKPNSYQTRIQFLASWVTSKLLYGNTYVLLERDARRVVVAMHVLDPRLVTVLVTDDGGVYYRIGKDQLARVDGSDVGVPASEVIHDRAVCLFHPLVGVGPIFSCGSSATQGSRIQANSAKFFENMSRPSGMLTAPATIPEETARRLKSEFESNFGGGNIGRLFVAGNDLKYEALTIPAQQAQMIEQLRWTGEDVARCFRVPAYKLGLGAPPTLNNIGQLNQDYYNQALRELVESIELLMDEGLGLSSGVQRLGVDLDTEGLLRMDPKAIAETNEIGMRAGYLMPDEAREKANLPPVEGGDTPYMQQQNWPLAQLAKRPPPDTAPAAPVAPPIQDDGAKSMAYALIRKFQEAAHVA